MIHVTNITVPITEWDGDSDIKRYAARKLGVSEYEIKSAVLLKKSLDARKKNIRYNLSAALEIDSVKGFPEYMPMPSVRIKKVKKPPQNSPAIAGFGPAGIFAALVLARAGVNPVVLERGEDADARKIKVRDFWENGRFCPESNVQFGEGGAGAFSDGKLTTGTKSPYIRFILNELVKHGAPADILYDSKPHIGTDLLSDVIKSIRAEITALGGKVIFGAKLKDFTVGNGAVTSVTYSRNGTERQTEVSALILAVGHSARDTFRLLLNKRLVLSAKPFSAGLRIEHLQSELDKTMYGTAYMDYGEKLPPADYKLAAKTVGGRGVYTFCMCPGGFVVASASEPDGIVTNGMSYHARNGKNANSALLVNVYPSDFSSGSPLAGIEFQRTIEQKAFAAGGYSYRAPAVTTGDFLKNGGSYNGSDFAAVKPTYKPGVKDVSPDDYLPQFICSALRCAISMFGRKIRGFDAPYSVLTGPETRSSSPVRIERGQTREALNFRGIYPCGEGAGYAGGIMSAATDGAETAFALLTQFH